MERKQLLTLLAIGLLVVLALAAYFVGQGGLSFAGLEFGAFGTTPAFASASDPFAGLNPFYTNPFK